MAVVGPAVYSSSPACTSSMGKQLRILTCLPGVGDEGLVVEVVSVSPFQSHWSAWWEDKRTSLCEEQSRVLRRESHEHKQQSQKLPQVC